MTLSKEDAQKIANFLKGKDLSRGLGSYNSPCSMAAINLALSGRLADSIPACMSQVIGNIIIRIQDAMPDCIRNSAEWKELLPLAAGTGRDKELEKKRIEKAFDWFWELVPLGNATAELYGFGALWSEAYRTGNMRMLDRALHKETNSNSYGQKGEVAYSAVSEARRMARTIDRAQLEFHNFERTGMSSYLGSEAVTAAHCLLDMVSAVESKYSRMEIRRQMWNRLDPCGFLAKLIAVE